MSPKTETAIAALNNFSSDLVELDQKVKSTSENRIDKQRGKAKICKVCGKEGQMTAIMKQIEAKHRHVNSMQFHDKTFYTRHALSMHNRNCHS